MAQRTATVAAARPYSPAELELVAGQLSATYADAEARILKILAEGNITEWKRAYMRQQLAQVRGIMAQLDDEAAAWLNLHVPTLYEHGMKVTDGHLAPGGLSKTAHPGAVTPMDLGLTQIHTDAIAIIAENAALRLEDANAFVGQRLDDMVARARRIARMQDAAGAAGDVVASMADQLTIRDASLQALQEAFAEGKTVRQAAKAFQADLQARGVTTFVDKAGREWDMRSYSNMVARTVSQEAQRHGTQNRIIEAGLDLGEVSQHAGACALCVPWEGQILSITGNSSGYPTVADATAAGLFHPNCAHSIIPYIGKPEDRPEEERNERLEAIAEKREDAKKAQRTREKAARKAKREKAKK